MCFSNSKWVKNLTTMEKETISFNRSQESYPWPCTYMLTHYFWLVLFDKIDSTLNQLSSFDSLAIFSWTAANNTFDGC